MRPRLLSRLPSIGRWFLCLLLAIVLAACVLEPYTGRRKLQLIPSAQMNELGDDAYRQILAEEKVVTGTGDAQLLARVGARIARVVDQKLEERGEEPYQWEFSLIASDQVNAFALPGGKVAFYTGILPVCQGEEGIAVVMGHEVAHAFAGHGNDRLSRGLLQQYSLAAIQLAIGGEDESELKQLALAALGIGAQVGSLAFDRNDESSADEIGLMIMAEAGYDPSAAVEFWKRMDQMTQAGATLEFLSTHPSHETRIADLNAKLPAALE
ncbi:MAG: M48 family metallopeptidase, partial [Planctomycetes bacterium]|nr:M48 family metallopeptidase [Planctomycetota bacterium]